VWVGAAPLTRGVRAVIVLRATALAATLLVAMPTPATSADAFPWKFNMSPAEVSAVQEFGPYRAFKNGDLETYKGLYNGHEENFQFFFTDNKLRRIGIYLYEGHDLQVAGRKWLDLYDALSQSYGQVETPDNQLVVLASEEGRRTFLDTSFSVVADKEKTQMAPIRQPAESSVFSSFWRADVEGERWYYVVVYFDRPP
jgi:hypothetical protein